jgi:tetratricopeptide (TPR) repeat protein
MVAIVLWALIKTVESIQKILIGFKEAWDTSFDNKTNELLDMGKYEKVIDKCKEVLEKRPNHINANWFIAKAYYYTNKNSLSKGHFEKTIYLTPSWEENANEYLNKLKER